MQRVALIIVAGSLLVVEPASAQECAGGRVVSENSAGRCCFPGQRWSSTRGRCEGAPTCPTGFQAAGDDCVAATPHVPSPQPPVEPADEPTGAGAPQPAPADQPAVVPPPPGEATSSAPVEVGAVGHAPAPGPSFDEGFVISGAVVLGVGYLSSLITLGLELESPNCEWVDRMGRTQTGSCATHWYSLIPFVGPIVASSLATGGDVRLTYEGVALGVVVAAVQITGTALLLVGLLTGGSDGNAASANVQLLPGAPGADVGASLAGAF